MSFSTVLEVALAGTQRSAPQEALFHPPGTAAALAALAGGVSSADPPPNPATDKLDPATDELNPATDELNPATDELNPAADELNPAADELNPAADELNPAADELNPTADELNPTADAPNPAADALNPATEPDPSGRARTTDAALPIGPSLPPEAVLLRAAAYEGLRRLAGRPLPRLDAARPADHQRAQDTQHARETQHAQGTQHAQPVPHAAPPESLPQAPAPAAARLFFLLDHEPELLLEWLQLAAEHHCRAPFLALPELLDFARSASDATSTTLIRAMGGERLGWLAAQTPDWAFAAVDVDPERLFADGSRDERRRALQRIREANPRRAHELLAAAWDSEPLPSRAGLLEVLSTHLSVDDEPLLERALAAARKEVREAALSLLRQLPDSRFAARWRTRAHTVIHYLRPGALGLRREALNVFPPAEPPAMDWVADGLDPAAPKGKGATAWRLEQLVANCPPDAWPLEAFDAFLKSEWTVPLISGLADAAITYRHADWCTRLLSYAAGASYANPTIHLNVQKLFAVLDAPRAEAVFMQLARASTAPPQLAISRPWSADYSRFMLEEFFPRHIAAAPYAVARELRNAASRLDPSTLEVAERLLENPQIPEWLHELLDRLVATLELRVIMRAEFATSEAQPA